MARRRELFDLRLERDEYAALLALASRGGEHGVVPLDVEAASGDDPHGVLRVRVALSVDDGVRDPRAELDQRLAALLEEDEDRE